MTSRDVHVAEAPDLLTRSNALGSFGFSRAENGALVSIVDQQTGHQFVREGSTPRLLWRLALRRADDGALAWLDSSQAGRLAWDCAEDEEGSTLVLTASGFGEGDLEVEVRLRLAADSPLSRWRVAVRNVGDSSVYHVTCPILSGLAKVGEPEPGEAIVFPRQGEGYLFRDPYPVRDRLPLCAGPGPESPDVGVGELHGLYPGAIPMQMCAYYNERAGVYLAAHDAGQNVKSFDVAPLPGGGNARAESAGGAVLDALLRQGVDRRRRAHGRALLPGAARAEPRHPRLLQEGGARRSARVLAIPDVRRDAPTAHARRAHNRRCVLQVRPDRDRAHGRPEAAARSPGPRCPDRRLARARRQPLPGVRQHLGRARWLHHRVARHGGADARRILAAEESSGRRSTASRAPMSSTAILCQSRRIPHQHKARPEERMGGAVLRAALANDRQLHFVQRVQFALALLQ